MRTLMLSKDCRMLLRRDEKEWHVSISDRHLHVPRRGSLRDSLDEAAFECIKNEDTRSERYSDILLLRRRLHRKPVVKDVIQDSPYGYD